jgi:hypothetical protein
MKMILFRARRRIRARIRAVLEARRASTRDLVDVRGDARALAG